MNAAKVKEVHARRAQLEQEETRLKERAIELADQVKNIEKHIEETRGAMLRSEVAAVRAGEFYEADSEQGMIQRNQEDAAALRQESRAMNAAAAVVPKEIEALHREHFDEFAAAAGQLAELAVEAIAALEEKYTAAYEDWTTAVAAWERLTADLPGAAIGRPRWTKIPAWPLPKPSEVFGATIEAPSPPGYVPPAKRKAIELGRYVAETEQVYDITEERQLASHAHLLEPDEFGFARLRRIG